ncbi:MAG: SsrA-binding protein SmpB [Minisyncoccia bacterium]
MGTFIEYKKAGLKFERLKEFEAGLELFGYEVKSLRDKQGSLDGSRIVVRGGEAYLVGATIPPFQASNTPKDYDPARNRRLLLNKSEIAELADAESKKGLTTVPIEVYNKGRLLKVRVAIVRGKGKADRREDLKRQDAKREAARVLKRKV